MTQATRTTKILWIKNASNTKLHVGALVSHRLEALSASRLIEGQIVDIARARVAIQQLDGTLAWVFAWSVKDDEIIESPR